MNGWQKNKLKFDKVLKQIITEPFDWNIDQNDEGGYFVKLIFNNGSTVHTREGMGDGYWSILTIVDAIYDSEENDIIAIDEPELSLHPTLQKRVIELLERYSKDRQIIITTHSSYFISLSSLINGGNLIRTFKDNDGNIDVAYLTDENKKFIKSIISDYNNPHILGLEAKELFFVEDNIIVTEGQEDVVIIPKICEDLAIELKATLFGWGAGGASKIEKVLKILKNLNYKKVTAIFDGDKMKEYKLCLKKYPDYNVLILPKDDIRDKKAIKKSAKIGITKQNGKIKKDNKNDFIKLLNTINEYHSI